MKVLSIQTSSCILFFLTQIFLFDMHRKFAIRLIVINVNLINTKEKLGGISAGGDFRLFVQCKCYCY